MTISLATIIETIIKDDKLLDRFYRINKIYVIKDDISIFTCGKANDDKHSIYSGIFTCEHLLAYKIDIDSVYVGWNKNRWAITWDEFPKLEFYDPKSLLRLKSHMKKTIKSICKSTF